MIHRLWKLLGVCILLSFLLTAPQLLQAQARPPRYLFYNESDDVRLFNLEEQSYRFFPFIREEVTIVAYGLDNGVLPTLTLIDPDGQEIGSISGLLDQPVVYLQFTARQNAIYTFNVRHQGDDAGAVRVMLFEGDPISQDITYLDRLNPLLPSRAFLVAGRSEPPLPMIVDVIKIEDLNRTPQVFASRATLTTAPILQERTSPIEYIGWLNDDGEEIYTVNIRATPESNTDAAATQDLRMYNTYSFFYFDYYLTIGAGSDPVRLPRGECEGLVDRAECVENSERGGRVFEDNQGGAARQGVNTNATFNPDIGCYEYIQDGVTYCVPPVVWENAQRCLGTDGADTLTLTFPPPTCTTAGNDFVSSGAGNDSIEGGAGNDYILSGLGSDTVQAGAGNDTISEIDVNGTLIDGGADNDTISYAAMPGADSLGVEIDLVNGTITDLTSGYTGTIGGVENATGSNFNDTLTGDTGDNSLVGGAGADTIIGNAGADILYGSAGNDSLSGGDDNDIIGGMAGNDSASGGNGNDYIGSSGGVDSSDGGDGNDTLDISSAYGTHGTGSLNPSVIAGGAGVDEFLFVYGGGVPLTGYIQIQTDAADVLNFSLIGTPIILNLGNTGWQNISGGLYLQIVGIVDYVVGSPYNDNITGSSGNETIDGNAGNDTIRGMDGDDTLIGNQDNDVLYGNNGNDSLLGGEGGDTAYGGVGSDTIDAGNGNDYIAGGNNNSNGLTGHDSLSNDVLEGGLGNDVIFGGNDNYNGGTGNDGDDTITDSGGNDLIYAGNGNYINGRGNDGNDVITDSGGVDVIFGGNNNVLGGGGNDGNDTITDNGTNNGDLVAGGNNNNSNANTGSDGNDSIIDNGGSNDRIYGGNVVGSSTLHNDGNDTVDSDDGGNDTVCGGNHYITTPVLATPGVNTVISNAGDTTFTGNCP